jgi:hypothetical protein
MHSRIFAGKDFLRQQLSANLSFVHFDDISWCNRSASQSFSEAEPTQV